MEIDELFPSPEETYEEWITRLLLDDTPRHRELYRIFFKN